jgi:hypothetical protein
MTSGTNGAEIIAWPKTVLIHNMAQPTSTSELDFISCLTECWILPLNFPIRPYADNDKLSAHQKWSAEKL